jgi:sugar phosphate isomerase/epimerase
MRVGIDTYTIRALQLNPYQTLDFIAERSFEGAQFGSVDSLSNTLDVGVLKDIKSYADAQNLYTHVSVATVNPITYKGRFEALKQELEKQIRAAAACGWYELRSAINNGRERYTHKVVWQAHIDACVKLINALRPTLEGYGCRINIETHGESTFDILQVIERTSPHLTGVCLDTANTLLNGEDPVSAASRVAPYTHLTHTKDGIVTFCDEGVLRQSKAPGMGLVDFPRILPILGAYCPDLPLSIEDHKSLFKAEIFNAAWFDHNPELTARELGQFARLAWLGQGKLQSGELPPVDDYEAPPFLEQMEERLSFGRDYLKQLLVQLQLDE